MASSQRDTPKKRMRPNIQITHQLNGRVKDFAAENGLNLDEAYSIIIETGLAELQDTQPDRQTNGHRDTLTPDQPDEPSDSPYDDLEFPSGRDRDACIDAIDAAADYLQQEGEARQRDIVMTVMPDHSLGYDVPELESGERYRGSWWRKVVKPGLEASPHTDPPSGGRREWRWNDA